MSTTPGRAYLDRRMGLLVAGKTDQMVDETYTDDAVLIHLEGSVQGAAALKRYFAEHISALGRMTPKATKLSETADALLVELTVTTGAYGDVTSHEAFVLRGEKAQYHFTALK